MKRIIFTVWDDISREDDAWNVNHWSHEQQKDYWDKLIDNKKDYADKIGVEFKLFHNTMKDFVVEHDVEFTKVNLYKHHLFAKLAEEYDEVMYIDMDVVFNTDENMFDELDLSKGIHIKDQDEKILNRNINEVVFQEIGVRNPTLKYHITRDLLNDKFDCHVMNTGIMVGKSEHIKKIKYISRIKKGIKKINQIKHDNLMGVNSTYLRMYYYPNNESLFSWIMEEFNIPYVLMDREWHYIVSDDLITVDWDEIKVAHFINKKFNHFFNDKTKCIYSIYIEIPDERLDNPRGPSDDDVPKSLRVKQRLAEFKDKLDKNHRDYADLCGAEFIQFGRDEQYETFAARFPQLTEYNIINLYKVWLLDKLTHDYDLVLYIDYDVYFADKFDAFNYLRAEQGFCCDVNTAYEAGVNIRDPLYFKNYNKDFRNPQAKYWNAHALLAEEDLDGDNWVFNTGIMMSSRKIMEQLDYFGGIDELLDLMDEVKEFSMYTEEIRRSFGHDNETIMSYKTKINNVPVMRLQEKWHFKHDTTKLAAYDPTSRQFKQRKHELETNIKFKELQFIHFISKNFGLIM